MSQEDAISSRSFVVLLSMVRSVPLGLVFIPGVRSGVKMLFAASLITEIAVPLCHV